MRYEGEYIPPVPHKPRVAISIDQKEAEQLMHVLTHETALPYEALENLAADLGRMMRRRGWSVWDGRNRHLSSRQGDATAVREGASGGDDRTAPAGR